MAQSTRDNWWEEPDPLDPADEDLWLETQNQLGDGIDPVPREDLPPFTDPPTPPGNYPGAGGGVVENPKLPPTNAPTPTPATPVGWNPDTWATEQTPKYIIGRILAKYPPTAEGVNAAMAEIQALYPGASFDNFDTISGLGQWEGKDLGPIDVIGNAGASNSSWVWYPDNEVPGGRVPSTGAGLAPTASPTGIAAGGGGLATSGAGGGTGGSMNDEVRNTIMRLLGQGAGDISVTDPNLAPAARAYRNAAQRETQRRREVMAERLAAQGLGDSGAFDAEVASGLQDEGTGIANFESQLILNEMKNRREELMQALQLGAGLLTAEQQRAVQLEIAHLEAALRREGMSLQNQQFYDNLGFNIGDREAYWNAYLYGAM